MLDQDTRYVFFNRLVLGVNKADAVPVPIDELLSGLLARYNNDECVKELDSNTATIRIKRLIHSPGTKALTMLFQLADQKVADPSFAHLKTGKARRVKKNQDEGGAVTAHVVIDLNPDVEGQAKGSTYQYRMMIEEVPRLSRLHITSLLHQELKAASKAAGLTYEPQQGKTHTVRAKADIEGEVADLDEELFNGTVRGVELYSYEQVGDGLDDEYKLKERRRSLILRPAEPATGSKIQAFLTWARQQGKKEKLSKMRLRYERSDGKERTAALAVGLDQDHQSEKIANALTRCQYLKGFEPPLEQCEDDIRPDLARRMLKALRA